MENQETKKTLTELLDLNFVKKIETFEELQKIYDYQLLLDKNELNVFPSDKEYTIIIFDTPVFNSAYVIDEYNKFMTIEDKYMIGAERINQTKLKVNVKYCDNLDIYEKIFGKYFASKYKNGINMEQIVPIILIINHIKPDIMIEEERFVPFSPMSFLNLYSHL